MPFFSYTVKNAHGEKIHGKVEAQTMEQAAGMLHNRELFVISLSPLREGVFGKLNAMLFGVKQDEIVAFTRQLATMITAGLTITESLSILRQENKTKFAKMLGDIQREIEGGNSFAKALESQGKTFSNVYVQLVRAGEAAGVLQAIFTRLAETLEKQKEFRAKTKGALIYPAIVILTMIGVASIMMIFVVPRLTQMYKDLGIQLPLVTQLLINASQFMANFWWLILIVLGLGSFGFVQWHNTKQGKLEFDRFLLRIPIMGPLRKQIVITEFCRTSSLLLSAGISVLQVMDIISRSLDNLVYQNVITSAATLVEKGIPLSQALNKESVFPPIVLQMLSVGEETGRLDEVMMKLSIYFETESEQAIKNLTTAFEPIIMVILGIGVGILVIAIILPIYNLTSGF